MSMSEIINVVSLFAGPISAVVITLWYQDRSEKRQKEYEVFKTIWDTHHDASIPEYSQAIRLVPIVFNGAPAVTEAWSRYMRNVGQRPSPENSAAHEKEFVDAKNDLISAVADRVGIRVSDRAIRDSVYMASSYTERVLLKKNAEEAQIRIAVALEKNSELVQGISTGIGER